MAIGDNYDDEPSSNKSNSPVEMTDAIRAEINSAWEDYDTANTSVLAAKQHLEELIQDRGAACKAIAKLAQRVNPGKKKIRRNGKEFTVVVRPRKSDGEDLYFFRGAKEDDIVDM
jgi:hypothetical protein